MCAPPLRPARPSPQRPAARRGASVAGAVGDKDGNSSALKNLLGIFFFFLRSLMEGGSVAYPHTLDGSELAGHIILSIQKGG